MDPLHVLVPVIALAFTVETAVGFGGMVITLALGSLVLPIEEILPRVVPLNVGLSCVLAARHGRHAARPYLRRKLLPPVLLGMPLGLFAFEALDRKLLTLAFGAFVLVLSLTELFRRTPDAERAPLSLGARAFCLFLAGITQGAFSTGGPLVVYVTAREVRPKATFRATLVIAWVVFGCVLLSTYAVTGRTNAATLADSVMLVLPLVLGMLVGEWVHERIDEARFKRVVFSVLLVSATVMLARGALT